MKLCAYLVNGTPLNELLKTVYHGDLEFEDFYRIVEDSESAPTGYQEIQSIVQWDYYITAMADLKVKDYKVCREEIKKLMILKGGFDSCDTVEQHILIIHFIATPTQRLTMYTVEQQIVFSKDFDSESIKARSKRWKAFMLEMVNRLEKSDKNEILTDLKNNDFENQYVEHGVEGIAQGDLEGLFDYLQSKTGTTWASTGLLDKTFDNVDTDGLQALSDRFMEILRDGEY